MNHLHVSSPCLGHPTPRRWDNIYNSHSPWRTLSFLWNMSLEDVCVCVSASLHVDTHSFLREWKKNCSVRDPCISFVLHIKELWKLCIKGNSIKYFAKKCSKASLWNLHRDFEMLFFYSFSGSYQYVVKTGCFNTAIYSSPQRRVCFPLAFIALWGDPHQSSKDLS